MKTILLLSLCFLITGCAGLKPADGVKFSVSNSGRLSNEELKNMLFEDKQQVITSLNDTEILHLPIEFKTKVVKSLHRAELWTIFSADRVYFRRVYIYIIERKKEEDRELKNMHSLEDIE